MSNILNINFKKRSAPSSLLGLSLDGSRLEGAALRRTNGSLQVVQRFAVMLSLDPLTADAELVGREILNHLEAAGVRERRCVVAIPLKWALTVQTKLPPKLSEPDAEAFLQIEAERGFPTDLTSLQVATSRVTAASGEQYATFIGIPRSHVERLQQVLRAAKLKPISFSLGISALQPAGAANSDGVMALAVGGDYVRLQITCGGGVAALRALEGHSETEAGGREFAADLLAREARITLGQMPEELRSLVKRIRIFGPREQAQALAEEIRPRFESAGMRVELVTTYPPGEFGRTLPPDTVVLGAFSLAARRLGGATDAFEFLPPKVSAWKRMTTKYGTGKWRTAGALVGTAAALILAIFGYQEWRLSSLRGQWSHMQAQVKDIQDVSDHIAKYRPWYDPTFPGLTFLLQLTQAFPRSGILTAKTVELRDMNVASVSGNAQSYDAIRSTIYSMGTNITGFTNFTYQTRNTTPIQFTFDFQLGRGNPL